ncbi:MAG TPA: type I polyketide synthase, partial [Vicinamibacteria bacterium]
MSSPAPEYDRRSVLRDALVRLDEMRARLEEAERARNEPIAIVGLGCRFPGGAADPAAYWRLLRDGVDAVGEVPRDRWDADACYDPDPEAPGKTYARHGAFLPALDRFDAAFFGISPREAARMDPQQRLLLEVAWEALEDAGLANERLEGSRTGVFVGITTNDYGQLLRRERDDVDLYSLTGNLLHFAAGRLSYALGLQGPALSVDTACSSSLAAVHLACLSLRAGECAIALAGGVNAILSPEITIGNSKGRMLARDGRCKTFDASADGYVRGEGCGLVVLKRMGDALADGDRILAVVRGSALNQDGRSSGLTVPNKLAQEAVIRAALRAADVSPADVDYVEAHGTGTPLGDPIEVRALGAALGEGRAPERPLAIGSVKTNLGHLESAAGIAGLIKVVLALGHGEIPPHLHLRERNPYVAWDELPLVIPTTRTPWPSSGRPRLAGVSSFGASGTNAHVIVQEAPRAPAAPAAPDRPAHLLTLSAKTEPALAALAARFQSFLAAEPLGSFADVCHSASTGRAHFPHRLAVVAESAASAADRLAAWREGRDPAAALTGVAPASRPAIAFLFSGQGSQYPGMGRELYAHEPVFRAAIDRCAQALEGALEHPLSTVLFPAPGETTPLHDTAYAQPALFALQYALVELWRSWGIVPAAVMGHSVGEYAAACAAGVFGLEEGLGLVAERGRLMQSLPRDGAMVAVSAAEERVRGALVPGAAIAAVNGPADVVVSGRAAAVGAVVDALAAQGVRTQALRVSHAFHSDRMDPILDAFEQAAARVACARPRLKLVSNLDGRLVEDAVDAGYWRRHAREAVRFAEGMAVLEAAGAQAFVEIGPGSALLGLGRRCLGA